MTEKQTPKPKILHDSEFYKMDWEGKIITCVQTISKVKYGKSEEILGLMIHDEDATWCVSINFVSDIRDPMPAGFANYIKNTFEKSNIVVAGINFCVVAHNERDRFIAMKAQEHLMTTLEKLDEQQLHN